MEINKEFKIDNLDIKVDLKLIDEIPKDLKKQHFKIGFGDIVVGIPTFTEIKVRVMKSVETNKLWIALPTQKSMGKWFKAVWIPKENMEIIESTINDIYAHITPKESNTATQTTPESDNTKLDEIPWDMDL